jgi:[NiFe] hydrogenase diaphorase moiety large subunit
MKKAIQSVLDQYNRDRGRLVDILIAVQDMYQHIPEEAIQIIADQFDMSNVDVKQTITFYHFLTLKPIGKYAIYLNDSAVAYACGRKEVARAFEKAAGISFNSVTEDGLIGLWDTADIGMNDQEPAALINGVVFTKLTATKAKHLVAAMQAGKDIAGLIEEIDAEPTGPELLTSMVENNIRQRGAVLLTDEHDAGQALQKAIKKTPKEIIETVKKSNLRGRGGAGFPAGLKWDFCRQALGEEVYLVCNADEGEPGTFKDRVILTELPKMLFEGMTIAGYAIGAKQGIVYLRYEYRYMLAYLEDVLEDMRAANLLGKNIARKSGFNFDIRIQLGAGAYVCGEETALIESMEGKRGEPRNRPPFPAQMGYLNKPTVVNNVESLCSVVQIVNEGAEWFRSFGTNQSAGTKLLSVSGDCEKPGIYEVEWGIKMSTLMKRVGANNVQAVQVGGPSGVCIGPSKFSRRISFEDLATGGSIIFIDKERNLLKDYVLNFMNFFIDESCGSCGPCRSLTVILRDKLLKILSGSGTKQDIEELYKWASVGRSVNRCGLGQTASNPILTTIENFRYLYEDLIPTNQTFISTFDMEKAVAESCEAVGRKPNIKESNGNRIFRIRRLERETL